MAVLRFILGGIESLITPTFILIVRGYEANVSLWATANLFRTACTTLGKNKFCARGSGPLLTDSDVSSDTRIDMLILL